MDGNGWDSNPRDDHHSFHGTHVAGTIGASTDNRRGIAGIVWNARMVPVRVLGEGGGTHFDKHFFHLRDDHADHACGIFRLVEQFGHDMGKKIDKIPKPVLKAPE